MVTVDFNFVSLIIKMTLFLCLSRSLASTLASENIFYWSYQPRGKKIMTFQIFFCSSLTTYTCVKQFLYKESVLTACTLFVFFR